MKKSLIISACSILAIGVLVTTVLANIPDTNRLVNQQPIVFEEKFTAPGCIEVEREYLGHPIVAFPPTQDNPEVQTAAIGHLLLYRCPNEDTVYAQDFRE